MFYQLVIDAIADQCYIYLLSNNSIIDVVRFKNEKNLSTNLSKIIHDLFEKYKINYTVLSKIYWVYGPGKFSSCRIVSIFAKTLKSISYNLEILTIDKFAYLATNNKCLVILESDANKYFIGFVNDGKLISEPKLVTVEMLEQIKSIPNNEYELIYDNDNFSNVLNVLNRFKEVNEDYKLPYFKPPC